MKNSKKQGKISTIIAAIITAGVFCLCISSPATAELYNDLGDISNPTFEELLTTTIPDGETFYGPVYGSTIDVRNELLEIGVYGNRSFEQDIKIHTLCNSVIGRSSFYKWTRWYQEDGNTQIFRLFINERNTRNDRPDAARVEAFSSFKWGPGVGPWNEWTGRYTIVKPHACAIFQAKNNINDWGIMLNMTDTGNVILNHRRHQDDVTIATNMTGKSFEIRVLDNGRDYMVWLNGELVGTGYYDRPEGTTGFRWGMYDSTLRHDALLFVSGATVRANVDPNEPYGLSVHYPMDGTVEDAGPAHYDGTLVGGSFTPSLVQHDQGLLMDGVDDYIEVPGFQGVTGATSRTCSAWIKTTQPSGEIMSWGSSDPGAKWIVRVDETGSLRSEVSGGYIYGTTPINDGLWHHVAAVLYSDSTPDISEVKLYVDGRLETIGDVLDESINTAAAQNVNIGVYSTVGARYFQGQIDDVRIYSYALAQEEIQSLASISPPQLDIIANDFIDLDDFVALAGYWLSDDCYSTALCDGRDLNADQVVNLEDFSELSKLWLCDLSVVDRVEDFEGYAVDTPMNGRISAGPLGGLWDVQDESNYNAVRAGVVATDADDPDNQVAKIENGHLIYRALSVSQLTDPIEEGESGILFFRFMYAENGANDDLEFHAGMHAFASDDNNPLTPENGNDLANFIAGFGASGTNGSTFDITTLDGATVLISGLNRYTWYDIWIIADNGSDTFDLYINPADGAAGPAGLLSVSPVATDVPFQTSTTQPLSGGLWVVGKSESSRGATVRLDEIAWSGEFLIP